jgi:uncharacterized protein
MDTTRQLFQLQELDIEIEQKEQSLAAKTNQLGSRVIIDAAAQKLAAAQTNLDNLKKQRRDAEGQVEDAASKIKAAEGQLYGGKVTNPKELSNLQHEINSLKTLSSQLQDKALSTIDLLEEAEKNIGVLKSEFKVVEEDWKKQQITLGGEIEILKAELAELKPERAELAGQIGATVMVLYDKIRRQKKQAVAKVEQGICRSCRISLSASALQRARSGQPVQCGSCGRILYIS